MKDTYKENVRTWVREYLSLTSYIDTQSANLNIRSNIPFKGNNVYILFVAIVIASVGLNVNSIPVIIGAMLISPLMGPIIGFGYGLGTNDTRLLWMSIKNLAVMVVISLIASTLYFLLSPLEVDNPTELLARTNPSIYDVLIAFFGGLAGMLEISRKDKGTVLSGVAIATALMPPLCTVGYGIANLNWQYAGGAMYLFFINSVFIALAAYIVTKYLKYPLVEEKKGRQWRLLITYSFLILIVIVPSVFTGYQIIMKNEFTKSARHFVKENQSVGSTFIYDYTINTNEKPYVLELRLAGERLTEEGKEELYKAAESHGMLRKQLVFRDEATITVQRLDEKEIMRDWIASIEKERQSQEDTIRVLRARVSEAQEALALLALPTEQLTMELKTQWTQISDVTLARTPDQGILVVLKVQKKLHKDEQARIENWLKVRLQNEKIQLIIDN